MSEDLEPFDFTGAKAKNRERRRREAQAAKAHRAAKKRRGRGTDFRLGERPPKAAAPHVLDLRTWSDAGEEEDREVEDLVRRFDEHVVQDL